MSLIRIEYGSIASSQDMNSNFNYLEDLIENLSTTISDKTSVFSSTVLTLNQNVEQLLNYRASFIDVGMIIPYLGADVPTGYLICDGSEVLKEDFEDLYDVIGDLYESSDSTLFKLPDLRNKTLWGYGTGLELGQILEAKLPNIKGSQKFSGTDPNTLKPTASGCFSRNLSSGAADGHTGGKASGTVTYNFNAHNSCSIYQDGVNTVQPPAVVVNYIIKY